MEAFAICALTAVMATHSHYHHNQLVRVCEYRCPREVDLYKYYYPDTLFVPWHSSCPAEKNVRIYKESK